MISTRSKELFVVTWILMMCSPGQAARGAMMTIDFDVAPTGINVAAPALFNQTTNLTDLYADWGVTFQGASGPLDGGAILNEAARFGVDAISGTNFLAFNRNGSTSQGGKPIGPEIVLFDSPVNTVSIFAATGWYAGAFALAGYRDGVLVATDQQASARQSYVGLEVEDAVGFDTMVLTETSGAMFWVYDDLSFGFLEVEAPGEGGEPASVPAPATLLLVSPVLLGLVARRRRAGLSARSDSRAARNA